MAADRVEYNSLREQYRDPTSLGFKKMLLIDSNIPSGGVLLDIGMGTGELISLRLDKQELIYGIDNDKMSLDICKKRFSGFPHVRMFKTGICGLKDLIPEKVDVITCLDVLEHIEEEKIPSCLHILHDILKPEGIIIFSGPGIFEKIRIYAGLSPTHLHSHSSFGWKHILEKEGFTVINLETVEFPVIQSNFLRRYLHLFGKCCVIIAKKQ